MFYIHVSFVEKIVFVCGNLLGNTPISSFLILIIGTCILRTPKEQLLKRICKNRATTTKKETPMQQNAYNNIEYL